MVSVRRNSTGIAKNGGAVRMRGASILIKADSKATHQIRVFDLKGRIVYKKMVLGAATVSMSRVLPRGNYLVSVRRDGVDIYKNKMRVVKR